MSLNRELEPIDEGALDASYHVRRCEKPRHGIGRVVCLKLADPLMAQELVEFGRFEFATAYTRNVNPPTGVT